MLFCNLEIKVLFTSVGKVVLFTHWQITRCRQFSLKQNQHKKQQTYRFNIKKNELVIKIMYIYTNSQLILHNAPSSRSANF